jgi:hypothetical protein
MGVGPPGRRVTLLAVTTTADQAWRLTVRFESEHHGASVLARLKTNAAAALAADELKDGLVAEHEASGCASTPALSTRSAVRR